MKWYHRGHERTGEATNWNWRQSGGKSPQWLLLSLPFWKARKKAWKRLIKGGAIHLQVASLNQIPSLKQQQVSGIPWKLFGSFSVTCCINKSYGKEHLLTAKKCPSRSSTNARIKHLGIITPSQSNYTKAIPPAEQGKNQPPSGRGSTTVGSFEGC